MKRKKIFLGIAAFVCMLGMFAGWSFLDPGNKAALVVVMSGIGLGVLVVWLMVD